MKVTISGREQLPTLSATWSLGTVWPGLASESRHTGHSPVAGQPGWASDDVGGRNGVDGQAASTRWPWRSRRARFALVTHSTV